MIKGRPLELAILRASLHYRADGISIRKRATPMVKVGGSYRYATKAGIDFDGQIGPRALLVEAKQTQGKSLPLSDFPEHQRRELRDASKRGALCYLVCAFDSLGETYQITAEELGPFLSTGAPGGSGLSAGPGGTGLSADPYRQSIPRDWFAAYGGLVTDLHRHAPDRRVCYWRDRRPADDQAEARVRVEAEMKAAKPKAVIDIFAPRPVAVPVRRSAEAMKARVVEIMSDPKNWKRWK